MIGKTVTPNDEVHGNPLPDNWVETTLGETCNIILGQSPPSSTYNTDGIGLPFYQGKAEFGDLFPVPRKWCSAPGKIAEAGDILISVRAPVGPTNLCSEKSTIGRGLAAIRPYLNMPNRYFLYYLRLIEKEWDFKATGTTFKAISGDILRTQQVPLPPFPEQQRIVAKIEELFTQLDAGVAALKRIQTALKRYKASVLKAACEGRLVPQDPSKGSAQDLLRQITAERRVKWDDDMRARGKDPKKVKYIEPEGPDTSELPELPEGWEWATISHVGANQKHAIVDGPFGSMLKTSDYVPNGDIPVITISNIEEGYEADNLRFITREKYETIKRSSVYPGDILVAKIGSSYGKVGYYPENMPIGIIPANLLKVTVNPSVEKEYIRYYLQSSNFKKLLDAITKSTAQPAFNVSAFRALPLPLPPSTEQRRIVTEVEQQLSVVKALETVIEQALVRAAQLRQMILQRAFEGRLVPQDPSDEPADRLVEKIRAIKANTSMKGVKPRRSS